MTGPYYFFVEYLFAEALVGMGLGILHRQVSGVGNSSIQTTTYQSEPAPSVRVHSKQYYPTQNLVRVKARLTGPEVPYASAHALEQAVCHTAMRLAGVRTEGLLQSALPCTHFVSSGMLFPQQRQPKAKVQIQSFP